MKTITRLWVGLALLIILSPLGLWLPEHFKAGDAWGEWGSDTLRELTGYIPQGLEKLSSLWSSPIPGYAFEAWQEKGLAALSFGYIISAVIGVLVTVLVVLGIGWLMTRKGLKNNC